MEKCKFCGAELEENSTVCPQCQKDNAPEAEEVTTAAPEETEAAASIAETAPAADTPDEEKKGILLTPGKLAAIAAVFVLLVAVIIALIVSGMKKDPVSTEPETPEDIIAEETQAPTYAPDGNPEDVTCKGTYTGTDADVQAAAKTVVAKAGEAELTNEDIQILYWSEVWQFLSQYGSYATYFGLNPTQSLDTQPCSMVEGWTWQQLFLDNALQRWQECKALELEAENSGYVMDEERQKAMDSTLEELENVAVTNGMESGTALLTSRMGAGATPEAYVRFQKSQYVGYGYFSENYGKVNPTDAEVEEFFNTHAAEYEEQGLTKDTSMVDVRHILIYPEGATSETVRTEEFSEEAWAAGEAKAQEILDRWMSGEKTEDSFAALANECSGDPGSNTNGGLYQDVSQGQMVEEFDTWCFDPDRQVGDTGIVKTLYGYHIMYFSGSHTVWQENARADLTTEIADKFVKDIVDRYPLEVDYAKILLAEVVIE